MSINPSWTADNRSPNALIESLVASIFQLEPVTQTGTQADFIDPVTSETYELKVDRYAVRNNSKAMYAEFAETTDGGTTLRPSGIAKQWKSSTFFLILRKRGTVTELLKIPSEALAELLDQPWPERKTAAGRNGNAFGRYSYGKLIDFTSLAAIATDTWVLPSDFDVLNASYNPAALGVGGVA